MNQGKVGCADLLALVHRATASEALTLAEAAKLLADSLGDVAIVLVRGFGPAGTQVEAVCARDEASVREWSETLADSGAMIQAGLGQTFILGRPRRLPAGPWPGPSDPVVQVFLVPIRTPKRVAGIVAMLRAQTDPGFSQAEEQAVAAVAAHAGTLAALKGFDRQDAGDQQRSELLRSSLRFMAGHLDSELALEPLLIQARQALGATGALLLLGSKDGAALRLVAAAGPAAPPADPGVAWPLAGLGGIAEAVATGRVFYTADRSELVFAEGPPRHALGGEPGPLWAVSLHTGSEDQGLFLVTWDHATMPSPEAKTLAGVVAELAALLVAHAHLTREAVGARAAERLAAELAAQRDAIVRQIVHDLRNAVHALGLAAEDMEYKPDDPARIRVALGTVLRQTDFMGVYLKDQLRSLEAQPLGAPPPGSLEAAFSRLEGLASRLAREGRTLRVGRLDPVQLKITQIQLDQILERLVFEASRLANPGGTLEVWAAVADGWATIMVEDDGPGLDAKAQASLAAERRKGNGSTSSIRAVEELVAAAGGQFGLRTRKGDRTSFHVGLPSAGWAGGA